MRSLRWLLLAGLTLACAITPLSVYEQADAPGASFGVEVTRFEGLDFAQLQALGARWIRYNAVLWSEVEPSEGQYRWERLSALDAFVKQISAAGLHVLVIVRSTPPWAQKVPGSACGPVDPAKVPAFAQFMQQLAARYKDPAMLIDDWELWNEPDVDPSLLPGESPFGCLGDASDPDYGGAAYAALLKEITPAIKRGNPAARVVLGGLLLDCDPGTPGAPGNCAQGHEAPARFLEGVLKAGGGAYLDAIGFHGYPTSSSAEDNPIHTEADFPSWSARGGVVLGKLRYIQELLKRYGLSKPVLLTESGLICAPNVPDCSPPGEDFYRKQADYGTWMAVRNWAEGLGVSFWFTYDGPGWRAGSILDINQKPKPVYTAIQLALKLLAGASSVQRMGGLPDGLVGYSFHYQQWLIEMIASGDTQAHPVALPPGTAQVYDVLGQAVPHPGNSLSIFEPVYIQVLP